MKRQLTYVELFFLIGCFLTGCSSEVKIPKTENYILNDLLQSAPASITRVDELPVDTLSAKYKDILDRISAQSFPRRHILGASGD